MALPAVLLGLGGITAKGVGAATGRAVAGAAIGAGHAVAGAARGAGTAIAGVAQGIGSAIGGALQGAFTPPDVVINNVGIAGEAAKDEYSGPAPVAQKTKRTGKRSDPSQPISKLLDTTISFLSTIEDTLQKQLIFDEQFEKMKANEARENKVEAVKKDGLVSAGGDFVRRMKEGAKKRGATLLKGIAMGAAVLTPLYLAGMEDDQLNKLKESISTFTDNIEKLFRRAKNAADLIAYPINKLEEIILPTNRSFGFGDTSMVGGETTTGKNMFMIPRSINTGMNANADLIAQRLSENTELNAAQIAGIIGGLYGESTNFNPRDKNPTSGAYGIAQWLDRKPKLISFAKARGLDYNDLETQIQFLIHELKNEPGDSKNAYSKLKKAKSAEEAAEIFTRYYERPSEKEIRNSIDKRKAFARSFEAKLGGIDITTNDSNEPEKTSSFVSSDTVSKLQILTKETVQTIMSGIINLGHTDTEFKGRASNKSAMLNKQSVDAYVEEVTAGTDRNSVRAKTMVASPGYESKLRYANAGTLDVIDPNYDMSGSQIITSYIKFFGIA